MSVQPATLKQELRDLTDELGKPPTQAEVNRLTDRSHSTYVRAFGGWNDALVAAGVGVNHRKNVERVELECDGPECEGIVRKTENEMDNSEYHYCSQVCHYEHKSRQYRGTGNPQSTLVTVECYACDCELERPRWKRKENKHHYCSDCWGSSSVTMVCEWCATERDVPPSFAQAYRFCSRKCTAEWQSEKIVGDRHPRWRGGYEQYYGPNWPRQRRKALQRDDHTCQDCGMTREQSQQKWSEGLSIHHIKPIREFITDGELDHEPANDLENLVSLCRRCHSIRETA